MRTAYLVTLGFSIAFASPPERVSLVTARSSTTKRQNALISGATSAPPPQLRSNADDRSRELLAAAPLLLASSPNAVATNRRLHVAMLFAMCTAFSLLTDMLSSSILKSSNAWEGLAITVTWFHFGVSAAVGYVALLLRRAWRSQHPSANGGDRAGDRAGASPSGSAGTLSGLPLLAAIGPIAACQLGGFLCTNLSLRWVPVSFSHTIKACECLFTAPLAYFALSQRLRWSQYTALIPTAAGVALSAASELHFELYGFLAAMASNLFFAARSVLSTIALRSKGAVSSAAMLYWLLCCGAAALLLPAALTYGEPARLLDPANLRLLFSLLLCGGAHFTYNLLSFQILEQTSPVTHVVLHALRRVVVIAASSRLTSHDLTLRNWAGIAIASAGVLGYALG